MLNIKQIHGIDILKKGERAICFNWYVLAKFMKHIISFLIGMIEFELFNKFYAKGDKKKVLLGLIGGVVVGLVVLFILSLLDV